MLKSALPPAFLFLSACTAPPPPASEPPSAPAADSSAEKGAAAEPPTPAAPTATATSDAHAEASPTRTLFLANCAQCHGEKGDGEGVTQLDRKARSFLDGGFSYGNTKDAILRSITHGIPGTPMPPFEKALSEAQRVELAAYVIAFGPDQIVVDPSESEMVVKDRPLVVYGKLPAIVEGASECARGLAIGTPDGLTFEYRTDDVQLVGVRAGRFLNRSDWGERGGTALEMLGQRIYPASGETVGVSVPWGQFWIGDAAAREELQCRFRAVAVEQHEVVLSYDVMRTGPSGDATLLATVEERPSAYRSTRDSRLSGFRRAVKIRAHQDLKQFEFMPSRRNPVHGPFASSERFVLAWNYNGKDAGYEPYPLEVVRVERGQWASLRAGPPVGFIFDLETRQAVDVDVFVIPDPPRFTRSEAGVLGEFGDQP